MLPEVAALDRSGSFIRIPPSVDVPVTPRVRRLIDCGAIARLRSISQLGMVGLVYPGATHSRLEHTLGVYQNSLRLLSRFAEDGQVTSMVDSRAAESFVLASLLHDVGHWPFCHPIEDMRLKGLGEHESQAAVWLSSGEIRKCLDEDWDANADDVLQLLNAGEESPTVADSERPGPSRDAMRFLASCLSGPIDVDKLDYLQRDSLHAGVPYGRNFDVGRLINTMCVHPEKPQLAVGEKGRTAAEMMVFARYVMFSEVYWHHAVRAATAMLQRSVFLLENRIDIEASLRLDDAQWIAMMRRTAEGSVAEPLVEGIFGNRRRLYKRAAEFNVIEGAGIHRRLARRPYWWLVAFSERLADHLSSLTSLSIHAADVLIDAPPVKLEVDINIDVVSRDGQVRTLGEMSPVASALAHRQFDDQVKRVRVFVRDDLRDPLVAEKIDWDQAMAKVIDQVESEIV